ncbi:hypothetical protein HanPSC8_Chr10g0435851 [Helianthus annuus]|nr:hypothetical protein HanPSC8_Chr10g0435851 [Helianthus annuus]
MGSLGLVKTTVFITRQFITHISDFIINSEDNTLDFIWPLPPSIIRSDF